MQEIVFNAVANLVDGKTMLILIGLWFIYRRIGVVECGVRSGLLAHITRIHSATTKNGYISKDTFQIATECYAQYKNLGGDGYADRLMQEINDLHFKREKKQEDESTT